LTLLALRSPVEFLVGSENKFFNNARDNLIRTFTPLSFICLPF
jgi:hypothetical protein